MKKEAIFLTTQAIAERAGVLEACYRTQNGKFILSEKDLKHYRTKMTPEEFIHGIDAKIITSEKAEELIRTATLGKETLRIIEQNKNKEV